MADNDVTPSCGNVFVDLDLPDPNVLLTESMARVAVGDGARPSGRLRFDGRTGRLQHEWSGPLGAVWLDVPTEGGDCGCAPGICRQNRACPRIATLPTRH